MEQMVSKKTHEMKRKLSLNALGDDKTMDRWYGAYRFVQNAFKRQKIETDDGEMTKSEDNQSRHGTATKSIAAPRQQVVGNPK